MPNARLCSMPQREMCAFLAHFSPTLRASKAGTFVRVFYTHTHTSPQVTRLERDASSGTALQEISFWLNLENALNRIQRKRDSPEVNLTLDVLKAGKRFHATVSFDSDTGI